MARPLSRIISSIVLLAACTRAVEVESRPFIDSGHDMVEAMVSEVITQALEAEAAGRPADSLYHSASVIVVNGRTRASSPLFAGIGTGGQVAISSSRLEIRAGIAWGLVDYRWEGADNVAREGRATLVLTQSTRGRWQIQHVHSSSPR